MTRSRDKANITQRITASEPVVLTDGMVWLDTDAVSTGQQNLRWTKTPSAGTTTLTGTDDNSITLTYTAGQETVFANGVLLIRGSDYTASNGTSVVLASGSVAGDVFEVISVIPISLVDTYTQAQVNAQRDNDNVLFITGAY
jgi:flagellar basal body L-ring protein FlgH